METLFNGRVCVYIFWAPSATFQPKIAGASYRTLKLQSSRKIKCQLSDYGRGHIFWGILDTAPLGTLRCRGYLFHNPCTVVLVSASAVAKI